MKCLILAAGYATRLYPLTENYPKPLLKVLDKTILDWLIDDLNEKKYIDEYIIVSNHKYINYFEEYINNKNNLIPIKLIDDGTINNETRLGAVKEINLVIDKFNINDDLMVIAGDNVLDFSLNNFIEYFKKKNHSVIMRYYEENKERIKKSASVKIDNDDLVLEMIEKPSEPQSNYCVPPFYIYKKDDLSLIKNAINDGCAYDAPGSLVSYLYSKTKIYAMEMMGHRYDIGNIDSYNLVNSIFKGIDK